MLNHTLAQRMTLLVIAGMACLSMAVILISAFVSYDHNARMAADRMETAMRVAKHVVGQAGQPYAIDAGELRAGSTLLNGNSAIIEQIANHASQQATGFAQISGTIGQIDAMTQQNSAMVEQSTAAINALNDEASGLRQAVGRFRLAGRDAPPAKLRRRA